MDSGDCLFKFFDVIYVNLVKIIYVYVIYLVFDFGVWFWYGFYYF